MNKTIKEAAREYDSNASITSENFYSEAISDAFESGAEYIMSLPLASRLTAEEREKIRKEYWQAAKDWIDVGDARGYCKTCIALESIFGSDFFKEGE